MNATYAIVLPISLKGARLRLATLSKVVCRNIVGLHSPHRCLGRGVTFVRADDLSLNAGLGTAIRQKYGMRPRGTYSNRSQSFAERSAEDSVLNVGNSNTCADVADEVIVDQSDAVAEGSVDTDGDMSPVHESLWLSMGSSSPSRAAQAKYLDPGLYIVGSPIGNLEDITLRALRVLRQADLVLAEDTRHSAKLLRSYGINTPMLSYHQFNVVERRAPVLNRIRSGQAVALLSDAGMPGVSDPGADLVAVCVDAGLRVVPIPGPCAVIAAIAAGGMPGGSNEFTFLGFLPDKAGNRLARLSMAANERATQALYVAPHKLRSTLRDCVKVFGPDRTCVVARELTKVHEEFWRGTLQSALDEWELRTPKGEITLLIQGVKRGEVKEGVSKEELHERLTELFQTGCSPTQAIRQVIEETGCRRNVVYPLALKISASLGAKKVV